MRGKIYCFEFCFYDKKSLRVSGWQGLGVWDFVTRDDCLWIYGKDWLYEILWQGIIAYEFMPMTLCPAWVFITRNECEPVISKECLCQILWQGLILSDFLKRNDCVWVYGKGWLCEVLRQRMIVWNLLLVNRYQHTNLASDLFTPNVINFFIHIECT